MMNSLYRFGIEIHNAENECERRWRITAWLTTFHEAKVSREINDKKKILNRNECKTFTVI